jgi:hypothetical protein
LLLTFYEIGFKANFASTLNSEKLILIAFHSKKNSMKQGQNKKPQAQAAPPRAPPQQPNAFDIDEFLNDLKLDSSQTPNDFSSLLTASGSKKRNILIEKYIK